MESHNQEEGTEAQSGTEPVVDMVGRRGAMAAVVTALGLSGLTGKVSAQTNDVGTASNPYRRFYVDYVVFNAVTSTPSNIPDGALHLRSDLL